MVYAAFGLYTPSWGCHSCPDVGTSPINWAQLSRFYLKTETESGLRSVVFWKINRMVFLDKDRTMDIVQKHNICTKRIVVMPPRYVIQKMHLCTSKPFVNRKVCFARPWANLLLLAGYYPGFKMNIESGWLVTLNCGKYRWITTRLEGLNMNLVGGTKLKFSKLHISLFMSSYKNWMLFARTSGAEVSTCYFPLHKQGYSFLHFQSGTTSTYKSCTHQSSTHTTT
jgi:hypothetical protein